MTSEKVISFDFARPFLQSCPRVPEMRETPIGEGWTPEQEKLVAELAAAVKARDALQEQLGTLEDRITDLREIVWDSGLDPEDALSAEGGRGK